MKNLILFLFLFVFCGKTYCQTLAGKWQYLEKECPEVAVFYENGTYKIYNDCYAEDQKNPIIETGQWKLSDDKTKLYLTNRDVRKGGGYKIWTDKKSLILRISLKNQTLKIYYLKKKESWQRLN